VISLSARYLYSSAPSICHVLAIMSCFKTMPMRKSSIKDGLKVRGSGIQRLPCVVAASGMRAVDRRTGSVGEWVSRYKVSSCRSDEVR
jgi:hypothetical protein